MKYSKIIILITATALTLPMTISDVSARPGKQKKPQGQTQVQLSENEAAALSFMREEEKLARDVYLFLFKLWGDQTFSNIADAEQTHMDALKTILDQYGLPDPASKKIGVFNNAELQELYDALIIKGSMSRIDALDVGALIEEVDIEDIQIAIEESTHADLDRVYGNLIAGSINHLKAFVGKIERLTGETYEAQYLPQEEVDALLGSE